MRSHITDIKNELININNITFLKKNYLQNIH